MRRGKHRPSIVNWTDYLNMEGMPYFPDLVFLAEGDSWFTVSGFPPYNLLFELRFRRSTMIVNCGMPGDTIKHIAQIERNRTLRDALSGSGRRWDGILLSGGGNDLIDEVDEIVLPKDQRPEVPSDLSEYCNDDRLQQLIDDVQTSYRKVAVLRDRDDSPGRGVCIYTHTYDYATPRNSPANFVFGSVGPWISPVLNDREVPGSDWIPLTNYLIDKLAEGILELEHGADPIDGFYVQDTRKTLKPAEPGHPSDSRDWQNEIHPNGAGYEKIAKKMEALLAEKMNNW
jgi:lysophospholipase L1-like esterase